MLAKVLCVFLAVSICGLEVTECNHDEDTWVEPNAWSRESTGRKLGGKDFDSCPVCSESATNTEDGVALLYYKKLIAILFKREKLQYNEVATVYQRSVLFSILPAQLDKLEKLNDPRDLDSVLTEIIATARTFNVSSNNKSMGITALILDIIKDVGQLLKIFIETIKDLIYLLKISEVRFTLLILSAILICWFVHHRYHFGYISIIVVGVLFIGYFVTYLECNRKLEIDEMLEFINDGESEVGWFSSAMKFFKKPNKNQAQIDKLKKSKQLRLRFCRPDHVFIMYTNDLFLKQLEFLIEKCSTMVSQFTSNLSFPYNCLAPIILFVLIGYVLKLTYKYILSPRAWASLWHHSKEHPHIQQHPQVSPATSGVSSITEDRVSGENLKLLLSFMKRPDIALTGENIDPQSVSGIEEVLEHINQNSRSNSQDVSLSEKQDEDKSAYKRNAIKSKECTDKSKQQQQNNSNGC